MYLTVRRYLRPVKEIRNPPWPTESTSFSDLTLFYRENQWQLHRNLVSAQSKWFCRTLLTGYVPVQRGWFGWLWSERKEPLTAEITLEDGEEYAIAVEIMIKFCYTGGCENPFREDSILNYLMVTILAEKYECEALYELAKNKFMGSHIRREDWNIVAKRVYENTEDKLSDHLELRKKVVDAAIDARIPWMEYFQWSDAERVIRSHADLATDLLLRMRSYR